MSSTEWETPQAFFDTLNAEFGFTIDACASEANTKCERFYSAHHDGLDRDWSDEVVWMNPPYDKAVRLWVRKAYREAIKGATVVCLLQARSSDSEWWHQCIMKAAEWRFVRDRLHFSRPDGRSSRANLSSLLVIFRPGHEGPPVVSGISTTGEPVVVVV
ncbi:hypothetical protein LCGC14_1208290 [marine sediment metagenome]|uniref:Phage N-6-adenine-methyltransferase n=1 Tax=marine sediment metagenome TaxID=412755 RepID=A0A0F9PJH5_9ZZZZ